MSRQSCDAIEAVEIVKCSLHHVEAVTRYGCGCCTVICLLIVAVCFLVFRGCVRLCV